jgi:BRCA1-associated protein
MALLEMSTPEAADAFFHAFDQRPFNSLEPTKCVCAFVKSLSFASSSSAASVGAAVAVGRKEEQEEEEEEEGKTSRAAKDDKGKRPARELQQKKKASSSNNSKKHPSAASASSSSSSSSLSLSFSSSCMVQDIEEDMRRHPTEVPQCVVCLEALSGLVLHPSNTYTHTHTNPQPPPLQVLLTACNHAFHMDCLRKLTGPLCPVCRYNHDTLAYHSSACAECGRTTDLWVCLVCGTIGCGRYHAQHSRKHYLETLHAYAIEVQTQQVWDYVGDGYVHRLLYHKGGEDAEDGTGSARGKLVEVADPHTNSDQRPRTAPLSDEVEEEMMHRKLESWAQQYTVLLSSGLEDQRQHFEARLQELRVSDVYMCVYIYVCVCVYEHPPLNRF